MLSLWLLLRGWELLGLRGARARGQRQALPARARPARGLARLAPRRRETDGARARSAGAGRRGGRGARSRSPPDGVWDSFHSQVGRGLQIESLGASVLLVADRLGLYDAHVVETTGVAGRDLAGGTADALAAAAAGARGACGRAGLGPATRALGDLRARLPLAFAAAVAGFLAFTKVLLAAVPRLADSARRRSAAVRPRSRLSAVALVLAQIWFFHYRRALPARVAGLAAASPATSCWSRSTSRWPPSSPAGRRAPRRARRRAASPGCAAAGRAATAVGRGASRSA